MNNISSRNLTLLSLLNSITSGNLFGLTSRFTPWDDENVPPLPSSLTETDVLSELMFTKRIDANQLRVLISRNNWTSGHVYSVGDIIITPENNIYECTSSGTSVAFPTWVSGEDIETGGSIKWVFLEYMDLVSAAIYSDLDFIPISWKNERLFWTDKAKKIRISFEIVSDENGFFPLDQSYRIAGIYSNPFKRQPRNNVKDDADFSEYGTLIGIDTFEAITRTFEQVDRFTFDLTLPD